VSAWKGGKGKGKGKVFVFDGSNEWEAWRRFIRVWKGSWKGRGFEREIGKLVETGTESSF